MQKNTCLLVLSSLVLFQTTTPSYLTQQKALIYAVGGLALATSGCIYKIIKMQRQQTTLKNQQISDADVKKMVAEGVQNAKPVDLSQLATQEELKLSLEMLRANFIERFKAQDSLLAERAHAIHTANAVVLQQRDGQIKTLEKSLISLRDSLEERLTAKDTQTVQWSKDMTAALGERDKYIKALESRLEELTKRLTAESTNTNSTLRQEIQAVQKELKAALEQHRIEAKKQFEKFEGIAAVMHQRLKISPETPALGADSTPASAL